MTTDVALNIARMMARKLIITGVVVILSILLMLINHSLGIIVMMIYSSFMMIQASRQKMPLGKFTAILPGMISLLSFLIMLLFLGVRNPLMPLAGLSAGLLPGWLMARGHRVYRENGILYAKRTYFYILIWVVSLLFTQGSTLLGLRTIISDFGFLLSGFSTAMMVVLSIILFRKTVGKQELTTSGPISMVFFLATFMIFSSISLQSVNAVDFNTNNEIEYTKQAFDYVLDNSFFPDYTVEDRTRPDETGAYRKIFNPKKESTPLMNVTFFNTNIFKTTNNNMKQLVQRNFNRYMENCAKEKNKFAYDISGNERNALACIYLNAPYEFKTNILIRSKNWYVNVDIVNDVDWDAYDGVSGDLAAFKRRIPYNKEHAFRMGRLIYSRLQSVPEFFRTAPDPAPVIDRDDPEGLLDEIEQGLRDVGFSDEAAAAGAVIAVLQLLAGLGLSAAMAAAQETAAAVMAAGLEAEQDAALSDNTILDGDDAESWMKDNGYYDQNGQPTAKYHEFMNSPVSHQGPGLQGFAGDTDENGNPTGNFSIVVSNGNSPATKSDLNTDLNNETEDGELYFTGEQEPPSGSENEAIDTVAADNKQVQPDARNDSEAEPSETKPSEAELGEKTQEEKKDETGYLGQLGSRLYQDLADFSFALYENTKYTLTDSEYLWDAVAGNDDDNVKGVLSDAVEVGHKLNNLMSGKTTMDSVISMVDKIKKDPKALMENIEGAVALIKEIEQEDKAFDEDVNDLINFVLSGFTEGPGETLEENLQIRDDLIAGTKAGLYELATDIKTGAQKTATDVKNYLADPDKVYDGAKSLTGIQSYENSLDPDRPVDERIKESLMGSLSLYDTLSGVEALGHLAKSGVQKLTTTVGSTAVNMGDDIAGKAAATIASKADDGMNIAVKAADAVDDTARGSAAILNKADNVVASTADDISTAGSKAMESVDNVAGSTTASPNNYTLDDVAESLKNKQNRTPSTIPQGSPDDFIPAEGIIPDTSGYTQAGQKHAQVIADKYGFQAYGRPTNSAAKDLLESGAALPKGQLLKNKTIGPLDTYIGFSPDDIGKVGHGMPTAPDWNNIPKDEWPAVMNRYVQRKQEFADQGLHLAKHSDKFIVKNNLILDLRTRKPFTGDMDMFDFRGLDGKPLPHAVNEQITKEMRMGMPGITEELAGRPLKGHANVMHGRHKGFDYTGYDRTIPSGGGQSKYTIAQTIDKNILVSHAPGGEALVTYRPNMNPLPGSTPNPTASYWTGGDDNPFVLALEAKNRKTP